MDLNEVNDFTYRLNKFFKELEQKLSDIIDDLDVADEETALGICKKASQDLEKIYQAI